MSIETENYWFSYLDLTQQHQQQHERDRGREREGEGLVKCSYKQDKINIYGCSCCADMCFQPPRLTVCPLGIFCST